MAQRPEGQQEEECSKDLVRAGAPEEGQIYRHNVPESGHLSREKTKKKHQLLPFSGLWSVPCIGRKHQKLASQGVCMIQCAGLSLRAQKTVEKDRKWVGPSREGRQQMESNQHKCRIRIILIFKTIF